MTSLLRHPCIEDNIQAGLRFQICPEERFEILATLSFMSYLTRKISYGYELRQIWNSCQHEFLKIQEKRMTQVSPEPRTIDNPTDITQLKYLHNIKP